METGQFTTLSGGLRLARESCAWSWRVKRLTHSDGLHEGSFACAQEAGSNPPGGETHPAPAEWLQWTTARARAEWAGERCARWERKSLLRWADRCRRMPRRFAG